MCFRALKRKWKLKKILAKHAKAVTVRSPKDLLLKRKQVIGGYNKAIRDEQRADGNYFRGMRDMLQWVLKEID